MPRQIRSSDKRSGCARSAAALGARLLAFTRARARVRIIRSGVGRTRAGPLGNTAITRVHSWGQWPDLGLDLERADYAVGAGAELRRPHRTRALVERTRRAPELFPPCHPLRRAASADEVGRAGGRVVRHFSARHVLPWRVPSAVLGLPPACRLARRQAAGGRAELSVSQAWLVQVRLALVAPSSGPAQPGPPEDHSVDDGRERTGDRSEDGTGHAGSPR